jgi:hypothetical protein
VRVAVWPEQIAVEDELALTVGVIFTVTRTVPVREHPAVFVPAAE